MKNTKNLTHPSPLHFSTIHRHTTEIKMWLRFIKNKSRTYYLDFRLRVQLHLLKSWQNIGILNGRSQKYKSKYRCLNSKGPGISYVWTTVRWANYTNKIFQRSRQPSQWKECWADLRVTGHFSACVQGWQDTRKGNAERAEVKGLTTWAHA